MLVVIPVSSADAALTPDFSAVLRHFGPYSGHEALVVVRPSDQSHGEKLWKSLDGLFDKCELHVFSQDGPIGWPKGPNFYWGTTCHHLQFERGNKLPWLWMELDSTPLRKGWLDDIETEYNMAKMPFLGVLETTHATDAEGNRKEMGRHLVGVAVYPPNIGDYSTLCSYAARMDMAFDVLCQWELVPRSHNSKLFQHGFRTQSYRRNAGGLFQGEDNNNFPNGIRFDAEIRPDAALFHGCDDGSLARAVLKEKEQHSSFNKSEPLAGSVMSEKDMPFSDKTPETAEGQEIRIDTDALLPRRKRSKAA
jgi:hypothetical protein